MAEAKTQPTKVPFRTFLATVKGDARRRDCAALARLLTTITKSRPVLWGPSIVGFGTYEVTYANGRTAPWPIIAFAPRATSLVLYIMPKSKGVLALVNQLGKCQLKGGCLHFKTLADLDQRVLKKIATAVVKEMKSR